MLQAAASSKMPSSFVINLDRYIIKDVCSKIDRVNEKLGEFLSWCLLAMIIITFIVVLFRYFLNTGWVWMQESVMYLHGIAFTIPAAYSFLKEAHVRVDVLYSQVDFEKRAFCNIAGTVLFLIPTCLLTIYYGFPYVLDSWLNLEDSQEAGGIPAVFLLKSLTIIFPFFLMLQGISKLLNNVFYLLCSRSFPDEEKVNRACTAGIIKDEK